MSGGWNIKPIVRVLTPKVWILHALAYACRLQELKGRGMDLAQRLFFLILKSRVFALGGHATKGFAIALRATSTAERHLLVPVFLEGLAVLGRILIDLSEYETARELLEAALPHVSNAMWTT